MASHMYAYTNAMLARFRAKHAELLSLDPGVRLYALVDTGSLDAPRKTFLKKGWESQHRSLYAGSGLDQLEQTGPALFVVPDLRGNAIFKFSMQGPSISPLDVFQRLLMLACNNAQSVSWLWTSHELEPLTDHLKTLLHARLAPDDDDAWFFFYQPSYLQTLHRTLPEGTRRYMFGPVHAWWMLDKKGRLVELAGEGMAIPNAWDVLPVPAETVAALQLEVMPRQVLEWLDRMMPEVIASTRPNEKLAAVEPFVERALKVGLSGKRDVAVFVLYGLRYGSGYELHPIVKDAIASTVQGQCSLIDAYVSVDSTVWLEVELAAPQLLADEATRKWHAELQQDRYVSLSLHVKNYCGHAIRNIKIELPERGSAGEQRIGDLGGLGSGKTTIDLENVTAPLPGDPVIVRWSEPGNPASRAELSVEGTLPASARSGRFVLVFYGRGAPELAISPFDPATGKST